MWKKKITKVGRGKKSLNHSESVNMKKKKKSWRKENKPRHRKIHNVW